MELEDIPLETPRAKPAIDIPALSFSSHDENDDPRHAFKKHIQRVFKWHHTLRAQNALDARAWTLEYEPSACEQLWFGADHALYYEGIHAECDAARLAQIARDYEWETRRKWDDTQWLESCALLENYETSEGTIQRVRFNVSVALGWRLKLHLKRLAFSGLLWHQYELVTKEHVVVLECPRALDAQGNTYARVMWRFRALDSGECLVRALAWGESQNNYTLSALGAKARRFFARYVQRMVALARDDIKYKEVYDPWACLNPDCGYENQPQFKVCRKCRFLRV